jgi:small subunit ribosomal protein S20
MPVTNSAKKALRKDRSREVVNRQIRRRLKLALKEARQKPTPKVLDRAASVLDRAAKKRVIHPSKAARLKSRLSELAKKRNKSRS